VDGNVRRRFRAESAESQRRTHHEDLQCMPLSGRGADISLIAGRRMLGSGMCRERSASPLEGKIELDSVCISHQFQRRHVSAPPEKTWCAPRRDFEHSTRAEVYAKLIGRPEGRGKRKARPTSSTPRTQQEFRVRATKEPLFSVSRSNHETTELGGSLGELDGRLFEKLVEVVGPLSREGPAQSASLIAALREATRNTPAEAVWDSMLGVLTRPSEFMCKGTSSIASPMSSETAALDIETKVASRSSPISAGAKRIGSPVKIRDRPEDSPERSRSWYDPIARAWSPASDLSVASTTATTDAKTGTAGSISTPSGSSTCGSTPSPGRLRRGRREAGVRSQRNLGCRAADWLREEQRKANRRRAWVA